MDGLSPPARRQLLSALVPALSNEECHLVSSLLHARLHVDLLAQLPLELVAAVAVYLPPWDVFVCRRVSRRWNEVLSSPDVCRRCYSAYYEDSPPISSSPDWPALFRRDMKRQLALFTGRPYSKLFIPYSRSLELDVFACCDGRLVLQPSSYSIQLLSLLDGSSTTFQTENRETFYDVRLSQTAVAALTTNGYCHLWNFMSGEHGCFRLPSAHYQSDCFVIDQDFVAVCSLDTPTTIIIWDLASKQAREIQRASQPVYLFLSAKHASLTVVDLIPDNGVPVDEINPDGDIEFSQIVGSTYSLSRPTPSLQHTTTYFKLPPSQPPVFTQFRLLENPSKRNTCVLALLQTWGRLDLYESQVPPFYIAFITHHPASNTQTTHFYHDPLAAESDYVYDELQHIFRPDTVYDTRRGRVYNYRDRNSRTYEMSEIETELANHPSVVLYFGFSDPDPAIEDGDLFSDDDMFFGSLTKTGINAWCFDEEVTPVNEVAEYRMLRAARAVRRAEERKSRDQGRRDRDEGGEPWEVPCMDGELQMGDHA
ncbi:hypothetical protein FQN51_007618 [Onygenales sp. PD_10]|nr:hypothetical protein FQN51_007618 [Onygenales sp. PD_10]